MGSPLISEQPVLSAGVCVSHFDRDSRLLTLSTRGSSTVNVYDMASSTSSLHLCTTHVPGAMVHGLCGKPKYCCSIMSCEVSHIFTLTQESIVPISLTIPKKTKRFYADVFPRTSSDKAALKSAEYFGGSNALPLLESLEPGSELYNRYHRAPVPVSSKARTPTHLGVGKKATFGRRYNSAQPNSDQKDVRVEIVVVL